VRRYHSVTYGHAPKRPPQSLQRSGTTTTRRSTTTSTALEAPDDEDKYGGQDDGHEFEDPGSFIGHDDGQQIYGNTSAGNSWQGSNDSWRTGNQNEWRTGNQMEDLSRAMGGMDLQQQGQPTQTNYAHGGPRFNSNARQASPNQQQQQQQQPQYIDGSQQQRNLRLHTDMNQASNHGPVSAGPYVPPIGHGPGGQRPVSSLQRGYIEIVLTSLSRSAQLVDEPPTRISRRHSITLTATTNLTTICHLRRLSPLSISIKSEYSTQGGSMLVLHLFSRVMVVSAASVRPRSRAGSSPVILQHILAHRSTYLL
jgi:hypothetical protein